jgi:hypothetical protein
MMSLLGECESVSVPEPPKREAAGVTVLTLHELDRTGYGPGGEIACYEVDRSSPVHDRGFMHAHQRGSVASEDGDRARRARENAEYVRRLLREKQPGFLAILQFAERQLDIELSRESWSWAQGGADAAPTRTADLGDLAAYEGQWSRPFNRP